MKLLHLVHPAKKPVTVSELQEEGASDASILSNTLPGRTLVQRLRKISCQIRQSEQRNDTQGTIWRGERRRNGKFPAKLRDPASG